MNNNKLNSIAGILRHRAMETPDHQAFVFINNRGEHTHRHTFASLDENARKIATIIRCMVKPNDRVLLLYPPGLSFIEAFFGCLYAGVIAVPAYPPRKNAHARRIQAIVDSAGASLALSTSTEKTKMERHAEHFSFLQGLKLIAPEDFWQQAEPMAIDQLQIEAADSLAFLQYTSGSTGDPKGVMVGQDNLLFNLDALQRHTQFEVGSTMVSWLPAFHDMGLIYGILLPVFVGNPCYLMAPVTFVANPLLWLLTIAKVGATHAVAPNFAFDHCYKKIDPDQLVDLDFSNLRYFANAAEPIREKSIKNFASIFPAQYDIESIVSPAYGLAEATLVVSCGIAGHSMKECWVGLEDLKEGRLTYMAAQSADSCQFVGCGPIIDDTDVRIVQPDTLELCTEEQVGEIWVKGPTVAKGYWQRAETTKEIFGAFTSDTSEGPFLRTGDLGFIKNGELFISGRLKDLIIIDGANYYPQDIEYATQQLHEALTDGRGAAFSIDSEEGEKLIIVQELNVRQFKAHDDEKSQLCDDIRHCIIEQFGIEADTILLVKKSSVPQTSSGKIRRRQCRQMFVDQEFPVLIESKAASRNFSIQQEPQAQQLPDFEQLLMQSIAEVLNLNLSEIDLDLSLIEHGMDSMTAMDLRSRLQKELQMKINFSNLLFNKPIRSISEHLFYEKQQAAARPTASAAPNDSDAIQEPDIDNLTEEQLDQLIARLENEVQAQS
ncbi:MAG: AMP-binding protein [Bacteroidota bacterium]